MKIYERLTQPVGSIVYVADRAMKALDIFISKMDNPVYDPHTLISNTKVVLSDIENDWAKNQNHSIVRGRKTKKIMIKSLCRFTIDSFILKKFNFKIHHRGSNHTRVKYNKDKLTEVSYMVTTLLFAKYREVYEFEVKWSIIMVMLEFFSVYSGKDWNVKGAEIKEVITEVLDNEDTVLQECAIKYLTETTERSIKKENLKKKPRPQCAEDFIDLRHEDMTTQEWYSVIQCTWQISSVTMYRYMHRFGMEVRQYGDTPSLTDKLRAENELLKQQLAFKEKQNAELRKMIETLLNN